MKKGLPACVKAKKVGSMLVKKRGGLRDLQEGNRDSLRKRQPEGAFSDNQNGAILKKRRSSPSEKSLKIGGEGRFCVRGVSWSAVWQEKKPNF